MGLKKYKGPIETIEDAMKAHLVVTINCRRCDHWTTRYAWKIWNAKPWARTLPLKEPVAGFRCRQCRRSVFAIITPGMR